MEKEANHCQFNRTHKECTLKNVAIRDQIVIGQINDEIRQESPKNAWNLKDLRGSGARIENACKGASEISGQTAINKVGKYS